MRGLHIVQPGSLCQGQVLHRSVGDGAGKPSVLQQLLPREGLAALQLDQIPLHRFHRHKGALLHLAAGSDEPQPRPAFAFVGTAPRASYRSTRASGGASRRFSRSLICSRFAREMTRLLRSEAVWGRALRTRFVPSAARHRSGRLLGKRASS